jgi:hypothetical protein
VAISPIYTVTFIAGHGVTADVSYAVPAGFVAVVRCLDMYIDSLAAGDMFLHGANGQAIFWQSWGINDQVAKQWTGRHAFPAGSRITVHPSLGPSDALDVTVSGYLLTSA